MYSVQAAAGTLGLQLVVVNARTDSDLETAFATFSLQRVGAVLVVPSIFFSNNRILQELAALAARHALPAIFSLREFAQVGGLMSYGSSFAYTARIHASLVVRIVEAAAIAHQAAGQGVLTQSKHRGQRMAGRQRRKLFGAPVVEGTGPDQDRTYVLLRESCESRFKIDVGTDIHNNELEG